MILIPRLIAVMAALLCVAGTAFADAPDLKKLVLDDCDRAKAELPSLSAQDRPAFAQYLVQVLHLKLTDLMPPPNPGHFLPKFPESNPAHVEPSSVEPLRAVPPEQERDARRCAVSLLKTLGVNAGAALPELIHYAAQTGLDDATRAETDRAIYSIAEQSASSLTEPDVTGIAVELVEGRPELARSVLLIVATGQRQSIVTEILKLDKLDVRFAAANLQELTGEHESEVAAALASALKDANPAIVKHTLAIVRQLPRRDPAVFPALIDLLQSSDTAAQAEAGGILSASGGLCDSPQQLRAELLLPLLIRADDVGTAAVRLLGCLAATGKLDFTAISQLGAREEPLVRARAAALMQFAADGGMKRLMFLDTMLTDPDAAVRDAALSSLLALDDTKAVSEILLHRLRPRTGRALDPSFVPLGWRIMKQLQLYAASQGHAAWLAALESFSTAAAIERGMAPLTEQEATDMRAALDALMPESVEFPVRLLKQKSDPVRFFGAELLAVHEPVSLKLMPAAVHLLGDDSEPIRVGAFGLLEHDYARAKSALLIALQSKNPRERGAAAIMTVENTAAKPAVIHTAHEWLADAGCQEFLAALNDALLNSPELRTVIGARIGSCLASLPSGHPEIAGSALHAIHSDHDLVQQTFQLAVEQKLNDSISIVLATKSAELGLTAEQRRQILGGFLQRDDPATVTLALPLIQDLGADGKDLAPLIKTAMDKPALAPVGRCSFIGALSYVAPDAADWGDLFHDEISKDDEGPFQSCAAALEPGVAQTALLAMLKDAPLRNRASILRRLSLIQRPPGGDALVSAALHGLQESNQDIRCQSTKLALRAGLSTPDVLQALRTAMYGECWTELPSVANEAVTQSGAKAMLESPRNNLERVRAAELVKDGKAVN